MAEIWRVIIASAQWTKSTYIPVILHVLEPGITLLLFMLFKVGFSRYITTKYYCSDHKTPQVLLAAASLKRVVKMHDKAPDTGHDGNPYHTCQRIHSMFRHGAGLLLPEPSVRTNACEKPATHIMQGSIYRQKMALSTSPHSKPAPHSTTRKW